MTAPNRATLWGRVIVDELAAGGLRAACLAPGSRSTPLAMAVAQHDDIEVFSHLDERSAAFFALGRSKRSGEPTAVVCTSGTAAANCHPAVIEADQSRVPLVVLTADRPAELHDSGANQTVDQGDLYGDAVRWARTVPEPAPEPRRVRSLRVAVARALGAARAPDPGPVHCNVPLAKPLEPTPIEGDVPEDFEATAPLAATGREGPFVSRMAGRPTLSDREVEALAGALADANRGLIVAGPAVGDAVSTDALARLAAQWYVPVLADPLSDHRFGPHVEDLAVCGGYDGYLAAVDWPDPDLVIRFGASPTSKVLRTYLGAADARQIVVDPAGRWPEAEFTATDLVRADPTATAAALAEALESGVRGTGPTGSVAREPGVADDGEAVAGAADDGEVRAGAAKGETAASDAASAGTPPEWRKRFESAETEYWRLLEEAAGDRFFEGGILASTVAGAVAATESDGSGSRVPTLYVSNSMPVRDLDRFARPRPESITALGNRGASGIDGVTSSALGAGSVTDDPVVLVTGDLAYYHDMNGLLALGRFGLDATIVLVNNDGGGIFHMLPIEDFDPPFTDQFRTPHGLDFDPTGALYDLEYERVSDRESLERSVRESVRHAGATVLEARVDAEASHRFRETLEERVTARLG
ncbi:MAG: 2-succinyl-5-enolpyruvyl-6-hydroxy-3-cyclohexene-1-carboxylic-acid synthase [Haloarculaceae archaeon]